MVSKSISLLFKISKIYCDFCNDRPHFDKDSIYGEMELDENDLKTIANNYSVYNMVKFGVHYTKKVKLRTVSHLLFFPESCKGICVYEVFCHTLIRNLQNSTFQAFPGSD